MENKSSLLLGLGDLEKAVLEHLWLNNVCDVQEVHAVLGGPRKITVNTVGSALERLFRKKLVFREKVSHAFRYRPAMSREEFMAQSMVDAAGGLRALSDEGLLNAFFDVVTEANEDTLDELEALIRKRKEQATK